MRATAYHNTAEDENGRPTGYLDGYQDADPVVPVFEADVPGENVYEVLTKVHVLLNVGHEVDNGADPQAVKYRERGNRSLSKGDVVRVGGRYYSCDSFGWTDLADAGRPEPNVVGFPMRGTAPL